MDLTIVIVNYNTSALLENLMASLASGCPGLDYEVYIIDNNSQDIDKTVLRRTYSQYHLIINPENRGFAYACNQGMRKARGRNIALLNPDMIIKERCLSRLCQYLDKHREAGAVGPQFLNTDGSVQYSCRCFPTIAGIFFDSLGLARMFPKSKLFSSYYLSGWPHNEEREVEQIMGACFVVKSRLVQATGYFDERFFMYFEEVDLCWRIREKGFKIMFMPTAQAVHFKCESALTDIGTALNGFYKSRGYFFLKHRGPASAGAVGLINWAEIFFNSIFWSLRLLLYPQNRKARIFAWGYWRALLWGGCRKSGEKS